MTRRSAPELFRIRVGPVSFGWTVARDCEKALSLFTAARFAELGSAGTPARHASALRADAPHAAHAQPTGPGPGSRLAWLQFSASRGRAPPFAVVRISTSTRLWHGSEPPGTRS